MSDSPYNIITPIMYESVPFSKPVCFYRGSMFKRNSHIQMVNFKLILYFVGLVAHTSFDLITANDLLEIFPNEFSSDFNVINVILVKCNLNMSFLWNYIVVCLVVIRSAYDALDFARYHHGIELCITHNFGISVLCLPLLAPSILIARLIYPNIASHKINL